MAVDLYLVEAGRRRTIHRGVMVDGADHIATERCNLDDSNFAPHRVEVDLSEVDPERLCGWCFQAQKAGEAK